MVLGVVGGCRKPLPNPSPEKGGAFGHTVSKAPSLLRGGGWGRGFSHPTNVNHSVSVVKNPVGISGFR
jgi:hypothetical protein